MIVRIKKGKPAGIVFAPPSKSFSHRELMAGMLSGGSCVKGLAFSEDILATLDCASAYGANWERKEDDVSFSGLEQNQAQCPVFPCRESGSTLRFFLPLALTKYSSFRLMGTPRLLERGIGAYKKCFEKHGIHFSQDENGILVEGVLQPGTFVIDASVSSQYVTGLLFALPLLPGASRIEFEGTVSSRPYIDITLEVLRDFGITIKEDPKGFSIAGNQQYKCKTITVEGDYSNAAFLDAFAYLGCNLQVKGLNPDSSQGDKAYLTHFAALKDGFAHINIDSSIDLAPVLFAFASLSHGAEISGISRLAVKESSRGEVMKVELQKLGINVELAEDVAVITPCIELPQSVVFDAHNDHRIAMALSLFVLFCDVEIHGAECVKKSFPNYFEVLRELGLEVSQNE